MRAMWLMSLALVMLGLVARDASAEWSPVLLNRGDLLPPNPVLYIRYSGTADELPTFRSGGTPLTAKIDRLPLPDDRLWRVALQIDSGTLTVDRGDGARRNFTIDSWVKPRTRSVVVEQKWDDEFHQSLRVKVESDANVFIIECSDGQRSSSTISTFRVCDTGARVRALYSDGTEAVIVDYMPASIAPIKRLARAALGVLAGVCVLLMLLLLRVQRSELS
jgi:hypothetical protein